MEFSIRTFFITRLFDYLCRRRSVIVSVTTFVRVFLFPIAMVLMLYREVVRIVRQLLGSENMFDYETTFANQLFLMYCLCGKIFFTNKIQKTFKYIWLFYHIGSLLTGYVAVGIFFIYDTKRDILMQLYLINMTANSTFMGGLLPLILYRYRDNIEDTIQTIDDILRKHAAATAAVDIYKMLNLRKNVILHVVITVLCGAVFSTVCLFDVVFFYEDEKVQNYAYYLFPLSNTEEYGSMKVFLVVTTLSFTILLVLCVEALAIMAFLLMWNAVCRSQLLFIRDQLNSHSVVFSSIIEGSTCTVSEDIEGHFRKALVRRVREFQQIIRLIQKSRIVFELFWSLAIPVTVTGVIVQFHSAVSENLPYAVKIKGIWNMLAVGYPTLLFCWIGETIENSVAEVTFAVYSTPWYWSVDIRKDVHVFLCQSQRNVNLMATKVLPVLLRTFARIAHFVLSTVNFLRQVSIKSS